MGFYRTGKFWAIENFGITPDIIVFGKALTNGLNPLSGIWAREELITPELFPPGSTHSTFSSNTLGTAVALETLKMMEEEDYEKLVNEKGAYFLAGLRKLQSRYPGIIGHVDGLGLALRLEVCKPDGITPDRDLTDRIFAEGIKGDLQGARPQVRIGARRGWLLQECPYPGAVIHHHAGGDGSGARPFESAFPAVCPVGTRGMGRERRSQKAKCKGKSEKRLSTLIWSAGIVQRRLATLAAF